jgi:hypothetical protein
MTGEEGDRVAGEGHETWTGDEAEPLETERLDLAEDEERLPWLESGEDDDYADEASGYDRMLGLLTLSGIALAAIVGGIWWASHRGGDGKAVADGSTIAAPREPYKEAPKNPGGKTFDGTGDTSFAVSEGQNRPAKMGDASTAVASTPAAPATKPGAAPAATAPAASGGVGVQVGAYSSKAAAEAGWDKLVGQAGGALSGLSHRVVEGSADIGKVYRLQAVAGDAGAANALCAKLKGAGISCQVK